MHEPPPSPSSIAILGGGPAGMACALWLKHLGFAPVIIEPGAALGGQLLRTNRVNRWVLGVPGRTGPQLAALYAQQMRDEAVAIRLHAQVESVTAAGEGFNLVLRGIGRADAKLLAPALVIATGLRLKSQELLQSTAGAQALYESGLLSFFPLDHLEPAEVLEGRRVAVIGGGDNAYFTAKDLASRAASTHLLVRSRPRAQPAVCAEVEALARRGLVQVHGGVRITGLHRRAGGIAIDWAGGGGKPGRIEVDRVFARTGFAPNTEFLAKLGPLAGLARDAGGYLSVDAHQRASLPFVYAIGDVADPDHPAVVTAIADGAVAARAIAHDLGV